MAADEHVSSKNIPTYHSSKSSAAYNKGKELMEKGAYKAALSTLSEALAETLEMVPAPTDSRDLLKRLQDLEMHESLGPFYYLYGSTLLYKVEDSECRGYVAQSPQEDGDEESLEDMEKAYENLDYARTILMKLSKNNSSYQDDLAQVHLRLGDLQRSNGDFESAIKEYLTALKLRTEIHGIFDRSVGTCHYMLGVLYILLASVGVDVNQPHSENDSEDADYQSEEQHQRIEEWHRRSLMHYLSCGYALGGLIGKICGADPKDITSSVYVDGADIASPWWDVADPQKVVSIDEKDICIICSSTMKEIRKRVKSLLASCQEVNNVTVFQLKEELDDIQEKVDANMEEFGDLMDEDDDLGYEGTGKALVENAVTAVDEALGFTDRSNKLDLYNPVTSSAFTKGLDKAYLSPSIEEAPLDDTTEDQNNTNLSGSEMAKQTTKKPDFLVVSNRTLAKRQTCCQQCEIM